MLLNSLSVLWQAKPNVKWLLEFIQRGQRENKNITRELQLQPSNMTSVCFCAFDWGPTFNGRFWLQDKQTVIGLAQPPSTSTSQPQPARQPEKLNSAAALGSNSRSSSGFGGMVNYSMEQSCGLCTAYSHTHLPFLSLFSSHTRSDLLCIWQNSLGQTHKCTYTHTWSRLGGLFPQVSKARPIINIASGKTSNLLTSSREQ